MRPLSGQQGLSSMIWQQLKGQKKTVHRNFEMAFEQEQACENSRGKQNQIPLHCTRSAPGSEGTMDNVPGLPL